MKGIDKKANHLYDKKRFNVIVFSQNMVRFTEGKAFCAKAIFYEF